MADKTVPAVAKKKADDSPPGILDNPKVLLGVAAAAAVIFFGPKLWKKFKG